MSPVTGDDLIFPSGAARLFTTNDFSAGTIFNSITFSGTNYWLYGASVGLNAGITAANTLYPNTVLLPLTLRSNQTFTSGNQGVNLYLEGPVDTNGYLQVQGTGATNATYTLEASTNLVNWIAIGSIPVNSSGLFTFSDTNGVSFPKRFYRAVWP